MNEMTWQQVLRWERLHRAECAQPTLLRFLGRPDELSPRARVRKLLTGAFVFRPCTKIQCSVGRMQLCFS